MHGRGYTSPSLETLLQPRGCGSSAHSNTGSPGALQCLWVDAGADGDRAWGPGQPSCLLPAATQARLINQRLWPPHALGSDRAGSGPAPSGCSHPRARKGLTVPPPSKTPPSLSLSLHAHVHTCMHTHSSSPPCVDVQGPGDPRECGCMCWASPPPQLIGTPAHPLHPQTHTQPLLFQKLLCPAIIAMDPWDHGSSPPLPPPPAIGINCSPAWGELTHLVALARMEGYRQGWRGERHARHPSCRRGLIITQGLITTRC